MEPIQNGGEFKFDMDGISAIMQDVVKLYGGEEKYFITGFEAGGHRMEFSLIILKFARRCVGFVELPGRWVEEPKISSASRAGQSSDSELRQDKDEICQPGNPIHTQIQRL